MDGGGGNGGGGSSAGGGGSGGGGVPCATNADCDDAETPCRMDGTCTGGMCVWATLPAGDLPLADQIYGDCKKKTCDGEGNTDEVDLGQDVYDFQNPCIVNDCNAGKSVKAQPEDTPCNLVAVNDGFCDGALHCVQCNNESQCPGQKCKYGVCVTMQCADDAMNGDETDVDCGGSCAPCPDNKMCNGFADCQSKNCDGDTKLCVSDCNDGVQNGDESDEGCGGSCALQSKTCANGQVCVIPGDCTSGKCQAGVCVP